MFAPCRPGAKGGGYDVRIVGIRCRDARKLLPSLLGKVILKRRHEAVERNRQGWTCLIRDAGAYTESVVCVRGPQLIVYKFS
jgi:hypothetical protein